MHACLVSTETIWYIWSPSFSPPLVSLLRLLLVERAELWRFDTHELPAPWSITWKQIWKQICYRVTYDCRRPSCLHQAWSNRYQSYSMIQSLTIYNLQTVHYVYLQDNRFVTDCTNCRDALAGTAVTLQPTGYWVEKRWQCTVRYSTVISAAAKFDLVTSRSWAWIVWNPVSFPRDCIFVVRKPCVHVQPPDGLFLEHWPFVPALRRLLRCWWWFFRQTMAITII